MGRTATLIVSHDVVGPRMAGPGIRYWQLAGVLGRHVPVTLAMPGEPELSADCMRLWPYTHGVWESLAGAVEHADTIVLCGDTLAEFPVLQTCGVPLVVDGYDPHPAETLALFAGSPEQEQRHRQRECVLEMQCWAGDFFICASERQRDWWLGLLEATGRINVHTYGDDPTLRRLVDVVPYGLPASPPHHARQVLKGVWSGISEQDKVVLWGGGLWQWLDPLTAIGAIDRIRRQRNDVRLVFPGTRHPNANIPDMPMRQAALDLAERLGLKDRYVFFGDWAPYEEWPNYLIESDVALSLHLDTLEAHLAFRSRMLDYVWADLPMVVSRGDATADIAKEYDLGFVVGPGNVEEVAEAILTLLNERSDARARGFEAAKDGLSWEHTARPLIRFCAHPEPAADRVASACTLDRAVSPLGPDGSQEGDEQSAARTVYTQLEARWSDKLAERDAEIARLRDLVSGYERGRLMRLMRWLSNVCRGDGP